MSPLQAILLGLMQGVTEFLPISSEAHLILTSRLLGWSDQGLVFDISAHLGSLLAVIVYFRRDLAAVVGRFLGWFAGHPRADREGLFAWRLALATVPVGIAGLLGQGLLAESARGPVLIGVTSIVFGLFLGWSDRRPAGGPGAESLSTRGALMVGLAQTLALVPGTSRSGVTITAGRFLGLSREGATRFSFLLAVPVGLLVAVKQGIDLLSAGPWEVDWVALTIGFAVSAVSAYLAIHWLLAWVRRQSLLLFVVYRCLLGIVLLAQALAG